MGVRRLVRRIVPRRSQEGAWTQTGLIIISSLTVVIRCSYFSYPTHHFLTYLVEALKIESHPTISPQPSLGNHPTRPQPSMTSPRSCLVPHGSRKLSAAAVSFCPRPISSHFFVHPSSQHPSQFAPKPVQVAPKFSTLRYHASCAVVRSRWQKVMVLLMLTQFCARSTLRMDSIFEEHLSRTLHDGCRCRKHAHVRFNTVLRHT